MLRAHRASQFVVYGAAYLQTSQGVHADLGPQSKAPTMGTRASELELGAMAEGELV